MTCAHVVHVALKKLPGVETVDVSLNKGLASVKLNAGNTLTVSQFWQTIHQNGYTPKNTVITVRGELIKEGTQRLKLKVSGSNETVVLMPDEKNSAGYKTAESKPGQSVTVQGAMNPAKDLKAPVPLQVTEVR